MKRARTWLFLLALAGCEKSFDGDPAQSGEIAFEPQRPPQPPIVQVAPYTGANAAVREAQAKLPTAFDLHAKVIYRTCGPNGGVCHNNKEYPDLRTPAQLLAAIDAPCNLQPGSWDAVYDRCERPGDRFKLGDERDLEIGYLEFIPGERDGQAPVTKSSPGLHIQLGEALTTSRSEISATGRFLRSFVNNQGNVQVLAYQSFDTRWRVLDGGRHLQADVRGDRVQELLSVGVVQGDHNRNGTFGARQGSPVPLLRPGKPEESYLIARLRGVMGGMPVPGTRMPLANQPLSVPEMLALFCFVEGLGRIQGMPNLESGIDYARCSYSADPESLNLLGAGVTWARRVKQILEFNCGGCHAGREPQGGLDLKDGNVYARLLMPSAQVPSMTLIKAGKPDESYLWRKLTAAPGIVGAPMPLNPLTGQGMLSDAELKDIKSWIEAGAVEDQ